MPSTDDTTADDRDSADVDSDGQRPFRDAEEWLAEKGIRREPLIISAPDEQPKPDDQAGRQDGQGKARPPAPPPIGSATPPTDTTDPDAPAGTDSPVETDTTAETGDTGSTGGAATDRTSLDVGEASQGAAARSEDQVKQALSYARNATANTPLSAGRLRSKMESRGYPPPVVTRAMQRARELRIVDDHAYAMALVEEGRGKGHAPLRIKTDMQKRDLSDEAIQAALATIQDRDPEAQAFAVARKRAERYRDVDTETAYRRLVGYLARRGYTDALSRKVAREAVFNDREPQRTAER